MHNKIWLFLIILIFLSIDSLAGDIIDRKAVDHIVAVKNNVLGLKSYRYKLTNKFMKKKLITDEMVYSYEKPLNIRIEWLSPRSKRGQLAVYSDNVMKAAFSWMPFVIEVNPDSDLGKGGYEYPIYRSTVGDLLTQTVDDFKRLISARVIEENAQYVLYELANDKNRANVKIDKVKQVPIYIEQFDLKGNLVNAGYFKDFEVDVKFPKDYFKL